MGVGKHAGLDLAGFELDVFELAARVSLALHRPSRLGPWCDFSGSYFLFLYRLQTKLIFIRQNGVDSADLQKLDVSDRFIEIKFSNLPNPLSRCFIGLIWIIHIFCLSRQRPSNRFKALHFLIVNLTNFWVAFRP